MDKEISENAESKKNPEKSSAPDKFLIVGIGASAGGIKALKEFFARVPADSKMAYVVILHLSPDHDSQLAAILQTAATIPVTQVSEKIHVEPNHIYVVPPNKSLRMLDGFIVVSDITRVEERRAPVDIFFRTLAESHDSRAVAVILSGTGANGSMGVKRVKEKGGVIFVQDPDESEYSDMPRHSLATGLVDDALAAAEIPAKIIAYRSNLGKIQIPPEVETPRTEVDERALREIFTHLRVKTGHDFSNYKRATVLRRIERRINVRELADLLSYAKFLREQPEETAALLRDLLISVTNFFRDHYAFDALETKILPRIFEGKTAADTVRVWVAGCATGEEAYSLAIMLAEKTFDRLDAPKVQIFATDIDETAIAHAREGFYTLNDAADVSPERLRRFFIGEGDGYRVRSEIREMILFAAHNLLKDAPFSHLDLVTCRNLLIYLNRTAQSRVMEIVHFALNPNGYFFLGSSESIDGSGDLFTAADKENHIFQSRPVTTRITLPLPDFSTAISRMTQTVLPTTSREQEKRVLERLSYVDLHQQLLEQYAPPSIVVNEEYDIVHLSERAGRFLQISGGEPTFNLLKVVRKELRLELRTALYQAVQRRTNVEAKNLQVVIGDSAETVNIHVRPSLRNEEAARGFVLVLFESAHEKTNGDAPPEIIGTVEPVAHQLEEELMRTKLQLRMTTEQYEVQTEEYRASNEELQALNEELRSTAEELETGKEELQSLNEEMATVNQQLKIKIEEISQSNNDFRNLINSTDIGTIFLDRNLRVSLFSPAVREIFNLIPADLGRVLSDITNRLENHDLTADAEQVLEHLHTVEREVRTVDGRTFMMRVLPYRTTEDRISGVVITFIDISRRIENEKSLRFQAQLLDTVEEAVIATDLDGTVIYWNRFAEKLYGWAATEATNRNIAELTIPQMQAEQAAEIMSELRQGKSWMGEFEVRQRDGATFTAHVINSPIADEQGNLTGIVGASIDISKQKFAEKVQREKETLQKLVNAQEEERKRLARDLHDHLGQQLTVMRMKLERMKLLCEDKTELCDKVAESQTIARNIDADLSFLAWELRPAALNDLGLVHALTDYINKWQRHSDIEAEFHASGLNVIKLLPEIETNIYRIAQEALNNIWKHAHSKQVGVILKRQLADVLLIIEDDGIGFDEEEKAKTGTGFGLAGMRERAALVSGTVEIESQAGKGTTIFVRIPFDGIGRK